MDLNDFEPDLLSPLPGASVLKKTKKKLTRTDYSVVLPAIKTVGFLKTIVPSWPCRCPSYSTNDICSDMLTLSP